MLKKNSTFQVPTSQFLAVPDSNLEEYLQVELAHLASFCFLQKGNSEHKPQFSFWLFCLLDLMCPCTVKISAIFVCFFL